MVASVWRVTLPCPHFFCQNAGARSEFANLRANMSEATAQRRLRVAGFQRALGPLAPFFRHFLGRAKKWHPKPAQRGAQQYARQKEKSFKSCANTVAGKPNILTTTT